MNYNQSISLVNYNQSITNLNNLEYYEWRANAFNFANNLSFNNTLINLGNTSWIWLNEKNPSNATIQLSLIGGSDDLWKIGNITNTLFPRINVTNLNATNITSINVTATRFTGKLDCGMLDGGSDSDYCVDTTGAGGGSSPFNVTSEGIVINETSYGMKIGTNLTTSQGNSYFQFNGNDIIVWLG